MEDPNEHINEYSSLKDNSTLNTTSVIKKSLKNITKKQCIFLGVVFVLVILLCAGVLTAVIAIPIEYAKDDGNNSSSESSSDNSSDNSSIRACPSDVTSTLPCERTESDIKPYIEMGIPINFILYISNEALSQLRELEEAIITLGATSPDSKCQLTVDINDFVQLNQEVGFAAYAIISNVMQHHYNSCETTEESLLLNSIASIYSLDNTLNDDLILNYKSMVNSVDYSCDLTNTNFTKNNGYYNTIVNETLHSLKINDETNCDNWCTCLIEYYEPDKCPIGYNANCTNYCAGKDEVPINFITYSEMSLDYCLSNCKGSNTNFHNDLEIVAQTCLYMYSGGNECWNPMINSLLDFFKITDETQFHNATFLEVLTNSLPLHLVCNYALLNLAPVTNMESPLYSGQSQSLFVEEFALDSLVYFETWLSGTYDEQSTYLERELNFVIEPPSFHYKGISIIQGISNWLAECEILILPGSVFEVVDAVDNTDTTGKKIVTLRYYLPDWYLNLYV